MMSVSVRRSWSAMHSNTHTHIHTHTHTHTYTHTHTGATARKSSGGGQVATCVVTHEIHSSKIAPFEEWVRLIARVSATEVQGHKGCVVIRPRRRSKENQYIVIFQYETEEQLRQWEGLEVHHKLVSCTYLPLYTRSLSHIHTHTTYEKHRCKIKILEREKSNRSSCRGDRNSPELGLHFGKQREMPGARSRGG